MMKCKNIVIDDVKCINYICTSNHKYGHYSQKAHYFEYNGFLIRAGYEYIIFFKIVNIEDRQTYETIYERLLFIGETKLLIEYFSEIIEKEYDGALSVIASYCKYIRLSKIKKFYD